MKLNWKRFIVGATLLMGAQAMAQDTPKNNTSILKNNPLPLGKFTLVRADRLYTRDGQFIRLQMEPDYTYKINPNAKQWAVFGSDMLQTAGAFYGVLKVSPQKDKIRHMFAGYAAASFSHGMLELVLPNDMNHRKLVSFLAGVGASISAGLAKEYWDSLGNGHVETMDAVATAGGGLAGATGSTLGSAVISSVLGGMVNSITLTVNTETVVNGIQKRINKHRRHHRAPIHPPF